LYGNLKKKKLINGLMDLSNSLSSLGILILLVILFSMVTVLYVQMLTKRRTGKGSEGSSDGNSTKFLDEGEDDKKCEICYGRIDEDTIAVCGCGKIFHEACAKPTGACPYCGAKYESMEVRSPLRARCPVCGRFVKGNICICGAVIPRSDGTFLCKCGNRIDAGKPICKKCGAVYESMTMKVYKEKK
jgi:hypothetical protein